MSILVSGGFNVDDNSIKWKFGYSRTSVNQDISPEHPLFELSKDFKTLTIKALERETWVYVEGDSMSGKSATAGLFIVKSKFFEELVLLNILLASSSVTTIFLQNLALVFRDDT